MRRERPFWPLGLAVGTGLVLAPPPGESSWLRVRTPNQTYALSEDGRTTRPLRHLPFAGKLSPDATQLLHVSLENGHYGLFVTDLKRLETRKLLERHVGDAEWLPDGRQIVFTGVEAGTYQIFRIGRDGKNLTQLTHEEEGGKRPRVAPDGRVAYLAIRWKKRLEEARKLPFDARVSALKGLDPADVMVLETSAPRKLVGDVGNLHDYAWSPDGTTIAYSTIGALVLVRLSDGNRTQVRLGDRDGTLAGYMPEFLSWRPDGRAIACWATFPGGKSSKDDHSNPPVYVIVPLDGPLIRTTIEPGTTVDWLVQQDGSQPASPSPPSR